MRTLRIELLDEERTLRLVEEQDGVILGQGSVAAGEVAALADEVSSVYEGPAPALFALGRRLYEWLEGCLLRRPEAEGASERPGQAVDGIAVDTKISGLLDGSGRYWLTRCGSTVDGFTLRLPVGERLRDLPWELIAAPDGHYLVDDADCPFVSLRESSSAGVGQRRPVANRPLRALFLADSPDGVNPPLAVEDEEAQVVSAAGAGRVELEVEDRGSLDGLRQHLGNHGAGYFDVLHLSAPADVSAESGPRLVLEDDLGRPQPVRAADLAEAVEGRWPAVLFLSGCGIGAPPGTGCLYSLAESLVAAGAPCVIAWERPLQDTRATALAADLYGRLGAGEPVDEAIARTRRDLLRGDSPYWHLLRVYVDRSTLGPLVTPPATAGRVQLRTQAPHREFLDSKNQVQVCRHDRFVGRRRALQRCLRRLAATGSRHAEGAEGLVVHGMGGVGKSSLAARLGERLGSHRRLVWRGEVGEAEFLRVAAGLAPHTAALLNRPGPLLRRVVDALETMDAHVLFVFDDFDGNVEGQAEGRPRFDAAGRAVLVGAAAEVLAAVVGAIRATGAASRVLVTCRYRLALSGGAQLSEECVDALAGAELVRKMAQLASFGPGGAPRHQVERAVALAGGIPRLLELFSRALGTPEVDAESLLATAEAIPLELREEALVNALLGAQGRAGRRVLAALGVCRLAVDSPDAAFIAGDGARPLLERAARAGLVEAGRVAAGGLGYKVAPAVVPVVESELDDDERRQVACRACQRLCASWWDGGGGFDETRALELVRLALAAEELPMAAAVADRVAAAWYLDERFVETAAFADHVLAHIEDHRLRQTLIRAEEVLADGFDGPANHRPDRDASTNGDGARAAMLHNAGVLAVDRGEADEALNLLAQALEIQKRIGASRDEAVTLREMGVLVAHRGHMEESLGFLRRAVEIDGRTGASREHAATLQVMGTLVAARGETERGVGLLRQALEIEERIGESRDQAVTLHAMGALAAASGHVEESLDLLGRALEIEERIGAADGQAATLHEMGGLAADRGDVGVAMELFRRALDIDAISGSAQGQATTLASIAMLHHQKGELDAAIEATQEAVRILVSIKAWPDLVTALVNLAVLQPERSVPPLAQACWLTARIGIGPEYAVRPALALVEALGPSHPTSLECSSYALALSSAAGGELELEKDPRRASSWAATMDCLRARGVEPDRSQEFLCSERLVGLDDLRQRLLTSLPELVQRDAWVVERSDLE